MVMLRIFRYLTAFCGFCILLLCYLINTVNILYREDIKNNWSEKKFMNYPNKVRKNGNYNVKNIVAYSLLKQIENESEEYFCGLDFEFGSLNKNTEGGEMWTRVERTKLYVFSVHFDTRLSPYNFVRIIAMTKGVTTEDLFCQLMSKNNTYHFAKAVITPIWTEEWNQSNPYLYFEPVLITCRIHNNDFTPKSVSLSTEPCRSNKNHFEIPENTKKGVDFTVCVKPLSFDRDISENLIQWIQMNELLGANKIVIYYHLVRKKTKNLLDWMHANHEKVEVKYFDPINKMRTHFDYIKNIDVQTIWQKRKYEIIAYNDCFYHNLNSNYVIPLDIDEIIVPKQENNWKDLFDSLSGALRGRFASFSVRNAYYFQESDNKTESEPVFFFRYVSRSKLSDKEESGKSFISSRNSLTVFNHYALQTLRPGIRRAYFMSSVQAQLNHYKKNCSTVILPECKKYVSSQKTIDSIIFKYKKSFDSRYRNLTQQLIISGIL